MKKVLWILFYMGMFGLNSAYGDHIEVCGDVSGTWDVDTVLVICDISIPPAKTLSIAPGVLVLFHEYYRFTVGSSAVLRAIGTESDTIRFDARIPGNGWHGIRFINASDTSQLEYCHLKHGLAIGGGEDSYGGGIYIWSSSPTITHCLIDSCNAVRGSAVYCTLNADPFLTNNNFTGNSAIGTIFCNDNSNPRIEGNEIHINNMDYSYSSGGIYVVNSNPVISSNEIRSNYGDGIICETSNPTVIGSNEITANMGSGISLSSSSPEIRNNIISGNLNSGIICYNGSNSTIAGNTLTENSGWQGGAIYCIGSNPLIDSNIMAWNVAEEDGGAIFYSESSPAIRFNTIFGDSAGVNGGGIFCGSEGDTTALILSNLIVKNFAGAKGGGISLEFSGPIIQQNTIAGNQVASSGPAIYCYSSSPTILNSIIFFNIPQDSLQINLEYGSAPAITYSDIQGVDVWPGMGNINSNPLFRNMSDDEYHLMYPQCSDPDSSHCIDAGSPAILDSLLDCQHGLGMVRSDMGAYGGHGVGPPDPPEPPVSISGEKSIPDRLQLPGTIQLLQNHPNPFNPSTTIEFDIRGESSGSQPVILAVYDIRGRLVRNLINSDLTPGTHKVHWDGRNDSGEKVSSGIYFYMLKTGDKTFTRKMILSK